jgi:hypothetical protein
VVAAKGGGGVVDGAELAWILMLNWAGVRSRR